MIRDLDEGCTRSLDPLPEGESLLVSYTTHAGPGRPRIDFDPDILACALELRGTHQLAGVLECSSRTIRRRALELGLRPPGRPVFTVQETADGEVARVYQPPARQFSQISHDDLVGIVSEALVIFPYFGNKLMDGYLKSLGYHIPRDAIRSALQEVRGAPAVFGARPIHRVKYRVPGPNSLWHHDGQHGMYTVVPSGIGH